MNFKTVRDSAIQVLKWSSSFELVYPECVVVETGRNKFLNAQRKLLVFFVIKKP